MMAANKKPAKQSSDSGADSSSEPKTPEEFRDAAWKIRSDQSDRIPVLEADASALDGYYGKPKLLKDSPKGEDRWTTDRLAKAHLAAPKRIPVLFGNDTLAKSKWGQNTLSWASDLADELTESSNRVDYRDYDWVLRFVMVTTQAAGYLLQATEKLLLEPVDGPPAVAPQPAPVAPQPAPVIPQSAPAAQPVPAAPRPVPGAQPAPAASPSPLDIELSLAAYTCAVSARNHIRFAEQALQNLRQKISYHETEVLVGVFGASVVIYSVLNPSWGWWKFPLSTPFWEVIFWSLFGAMAASYIRVNDDATKGLFDSRHPFQYVYRIVTAPFVAVVIVFLWTVVGVSLSSSGTASALTLGTGTLVNLATLIVLSFLLGFFSKEALDILKHAWYGIAQQTESSEKGSSS